MAANQLGSQANRSDLIARVVDAGGNPVKGSRVQFSMAADPSGGSIVTAETIAANGSETYSYTVTFTLSNAALAGDCSNPSGGLRNRAALGFNAPPDGLTFVAARYD